MCSSDLVVKRGVNPVLRGFDPVTSCASAGDTDHWGRLGFVIGSGGCVVLRWESGGATELNQKVQKLHVGRERTANAGGRQPLLRTCAQRVRALAACVPCVQGKNEGRRVLTRTERTNLNERMQNLTTT